MIKSILKYAGKYKILTIVATIMVVIAVAAQILPYIFAYQIISPLIAGESITWQFAVGRVVGVAVCLVLNFVFYIGGLSLSHIAAFNTLYNLRVSLQGKMEKLPLGVVQEKGTGNLKNCSWTTWRAWNFCSRTPYPKASAICSFPLACLLPCSRSIGNSRY